MKKITALLLCFLLLCACSVTAFAAEDEEITNTVISVTVPDTHKITVKADSARVFYEGISGDEFAVERLSEPRFLIRAESGKKIKSVMLNGEDVTEQLYGGYLTLSPVYEEKVITVTTIDAPAEPEEGYTVKGKITLDGEPLADADIELRPTLKTTKTDKDGNFVFEDLAPGEHSLTVIKDGKVIGYLLFELKEDDKSDFSLMDDGTYTVSVDQSGAGVELNLVLNEEEGTIAPAEISTIEKADSNAPQTGDNTNLFVWCHLLALSASCIVVTEFLRRKKRNK